VDIWIGKPSVFKTGKKSACQKGHMHIKIGRYIVSNFIENFTTDTANFRQNSDTLRK